MKRVGGGKPSRACGLLFVEDYFGKRREVNKTTIDNLLYDLSSDDLN
jgi:hypothetical protein